jgi:hypothetical protein
MSAPPPRLLAVLAFAMAIALGGCGKAPAPAPEGFANGAAAVTPPAAHGVVSVATKNTTRLGGPDAATDAAAVARAVYPGLTAATRPQVIVLVDEHNWPAALASSTLASAPLGAAVLYADGDALPQATVLALHALHPLGAAALGGTQVIRIGTSAAVPDGYRTSTLASASDPASIAAAVQRQGALARGSSPRQVIVVASNAPRALQMPAAGLSAESGAPILLLGASGVPTATATALEGLHQPAIYLLGAASVDTATLAALGSFGRVTPIAGASAPATPGEGTPAENAIAVARFAHGSFGWGIHEAGHGLVFASASRPLDAPAAAPLSAHGDYAPLLLLESSTSVPPPLTRYLSNIEPGYTTTIGPVREVYNHGWMIGDERAISSVVQAEIDAILEIAPRASSEANAPPPVE